RLSRDRFRGNDNASASHTFGYALYTVAQLMAPLAPFFPELIHHNLVNQDTSIHHTDWPQVKSKLHQPDLESSMNIAKQVVELVRAKRHEQALKLKQPLASVTIEANQPAPDQALLDVLADETNIKQVRWQENPQTSELSVQLDTNLTPE